MGRHSVRVVPAHEAATIVQSIIDAAGESIATFQHSRIGPLALKLKATVPARTQVRPYFAPPFAAAARLGTARPPGNRYPRRRERISRLQRGGCGRRDQRRITREEIRGMGRNRFIQRRSIDLNSPVEGRRQRSASYRETRGPIEARANVPFIHNGAHHHQRCGARPLGIRQDASELQGRRMAPIKMQLFDS